MGEGTERHMGGHWRLCGWGCQGRSLSILVSGMGMFQTARIWELLCGILLLFHTEGVGHLGWGGGRAALDCGLVRGGSGALTPGERGHPQQSRGQNWEG